MACSSCRLFASLKAPKGSLSLTKRVLTESEKKDAQDRPREAPAHAVSIEREDNKNTGNVQKGSGTEEHLGCLERD